MSWLELTDIDGSINDDNKLVELPWAYLHSFYVRLVVWSIV